MQEAGKIFAGRYRIAEEVGRGGMAIVYRATDERMSRTVALKVLYPYLAVREENKVRFQREAQVVANLDHPNIVKVWDYSGLDSDDSFIVAEFIEGITLKRFRADHPSILPEIAAMMVEQVGSALQHAHTNGITHRDVKPENVMLSSEGTLKLMDFGIAQIKDVAQMTVTGTMIGSPAHMSPEHIEGKQLDHRADIFSLGTLFYTLAVGELPFTGNTAHALLRNILEANYVPALRAEPAVGGELSDMISRCMQRLPGERYQSCEALCKELRIFLAEKGFDDPATELAHYFKNPALYQQAARQRVTERLLKQGRTLVKKGKIGDALRSFDRALALDENRKDVLDEIERLSRRVEFKRAMFRYVLPALSVILLASAAAYAIVTTDLFGWKDAPDYVARGSNAHPELVHGPGFHDAAAPVRDISETRLRPPSVDVVPTQEPDAQPRVAVLADPDVTSEPDLTATAGPPDARSPPGPDLTAEPPEVVSAALPDVAPADTASPPPEDPDVRQAPSLDAGPAEPKVRDVKSKPVEKPEENTNGSGKPAEPKNGSEPDVVAENDAGSGESGDPGGTQVEGETDNSPVPVTIRAFPPACDIYIDKEKVGTGKIVEHMLAPGKHHLWVRHPTCGIACNDIDKVIEVKPGLPLELPVARIEYRPAGVKAVSEHHGLMMVGGERATFGKTVRLETKEPHSWTVSATFIVYFEDREETFTRDIKVHPGVTTKVHVDKYLKSP